MDTNKHELILKNEVYSVVGCAMEVLNVLGHGLNEKNYENGLAVEFGLQGIPFVQQKRFPVVYKETQVGEFVPDLITHEALIVDTKVLEKITDRERGQMLNYLKIAKLRIGLLINFYHPRLEWERVIL
ncbi:MAG TPA: GxxExxY protein [Opitutales bacterium]|nr:GxxExxY protein [Opitutales bacterium]